MLSCGASVCISLKTVHLVSARQLRELARFDSSHDLNGTGAKATKAMSGSQEDQRKLAKAGQTDSETITKRKTCDTFQHSLASAWRRKHHLMLSKYSKKAGKIEPHRRMTSCNCCIMTSVLPRSVIDSTRLL